MMLSVLPRPSIVSYESQQNGAIYTHGVCQNANSGAYIRLVIYGIFTNTVPLTSSSQL